MAKPDTITAEKEPSDSLPKWALPAILVFTAILYSKALQNGLTSFDDDYYLVNNPFLKDFSWNGIKAIFTSFYGGNYNPLTTITYLFEYKFFSLDPLPYHLFNVLLHLVNTILVFKLTEQLSGKKITALIVCALFAIHPMHVESVAWVSERKDVLYSLFYLSALLAYLKYITSGRKANIYIYCLMLFTLSLLSKSAAVTLPVLMFAIDVYKCRAINKAALFDKVPFLLLSLLFGIFNILAQGAHGAIADIDSTYSLFNRVCLFTGSLSFYIIKLVVPANLSAMHFFPDVENSRLPVLFYCSLPFLALLIWGITRKNNYRKEMLFGFSFFLITILPMLQIIPVGTIMTAERYSYIPYLGLFYIPGQFIASHAKFRKIMIAILSLFAFVFSLLTWHRIGIWTNDKTLFSDIIKKDTPHSNRMSTTLFDNGSEKLKAGDKEGAMEKFNEAILFCPQFANAYFNRAFLYLDAGDFKSAIADYSKSLEYTSDPAIVYYCRAKAYYEEGKTDSAMYDYNKTISYNSNYAPAYNNRAVIKIHTKNTTGACADWAKASALNDTNAKRMINLYCH